jgi:hypothetical protein
MPFLVINSIDMPVAVDTLTESIREIGQISYSYSGTPVRSRQTTKRDLEFDLALTTPVLAGQYERWIRGEGEMWTFNTSLYGGKGTAPQAGYSGTISSGGGIGSSDALAVSSGSHAYRIAPSGSSWTISFYYSSTSPAAYTHYTITSAGKKWVDGVRNDAASTTFVSVSSGILTLTGGTNRRWDNLFAFPATVDDTWPPLFYGTAGNGLIASGSLSPPQLTLTGDVILETTRTAMGEATQTAVVSAQGGSLRRVSVKLSQT